MIHFQTHRGDAGPGAITTTTTFSSQNTSADGAVAMAIAIAIVAVLTFAFYRFVGDALSKVKRTTLAILARLGGLILATLGFLMFLNGLKNFFAGRTLSATCARRRERRTRGTSRTAGAAGCSAQWRRTPASKHHAADHDATATRSGGAARTS